jgi:hypothetical protein
VNDLLLRELAPPAKVSLGGKEYSLSFPMQAVILYKQETAKIDRQRSADRPKLGREQLQELRKRRQQAIREAQPFAPKKGDEWLTESREQFEALMEEATALKIQIDEAAGTGDSLFDLNNWRKIGLDIDPERLLLALWVGLHRSEDKVFQASLSLEELAPLVNARNAIAITTAISEALTSSLIAKDDEPKNGHAPETSPAPTSETTSA